MSWFKRSEKGIQTKTEEKKDIPKGLWYRTTTGKIIESQELAENNYVSPEDDFHVIRRPQRRLCQLAWRLAALPRCRC